MSFFVIVKGCVNFHEMTPLHKNAYSNAESFSHWELILKTTASLSNLIPLFFYYLTNLVSGAYAQVVLMPRLLDRNTHLYIL